MDPGEFGFQVSSRSTQAPQLSRMAASVVGIGLFFFVGPMRMGLGTSSTWRVKGSFSLFWMKRALSLEPSLKHGGDQRAQVEKS